jgi:hypothetical protein
MAITGNNVIIDDNSFDNPYWVNPIGNTSMAPNNVVTSGFSIPSLSMFNGLGDWLSKGDNLKGLGELTQGISGVLSYLNGRKGLALARDQLDTAKNQWLAGYNNEVQLQNNKTRDILGPRLMQNTGSKDNLEQEYNLRRLNTLNSI